MKCNGITQVTDAGVPVVEEPSLKYHPPQFQTLQNRGPPAGAVVNSKSRKKHKKTQNKKNPKKIKVKA